MRFTEKTLREAYESPEIDIITLSMEKCVLEGSNPGDTPDDMESGGWL